MGEPMWCELGLQEYTGRGPVACTSYLVITHPVGSFCSIEIVGGEGAVQGWGFSINTALGAIPG